MKRVTKNNILKLIDMIDYLISNDINDLNVCYKVNDYIKNVINKDKHFYNKLNSYELNDKQKDTLLFVGIC